MKKILLTALLLGGLMATAGVTGNVFRQASSTDGRQSEPEVTNTLRAEGENASEYAYGNKWYGNAEWTSGNLTVSFDYTLTALENNHLQVDATIEGLDKVPGLAVLQMQIGVGGWTNAVKNEDGSYTWVSLDNPTFELGNDVAPLHFYFPYESGGVVNQAIDGYKFGAANEKPVKEILPKITAKAQNITANSAEIAYEVTLPEELTGATVKVYLNDAEATASPIALTDLTPSTDYSYTMKAVASKDGQDYTGKEVKVEFKTNRDATAAKVWNTIKDGFINNVPVSIETAIAYNPNSTVTITAVPHCAKAIEGLVWKACACLVGGDRIMDMALVDGKYTYTTEATFEENVGLYVYYFAAFAGGDARLDIEGYKTDLENDAVAYGEPASIEMSGVPATMIVNEPYNVSSIVKDNNGHYLVEKAADCTVAAPFTLVDGVLTATAKGIGNINATCGDATSVIALECFLDSDAQGVHALNATYEADGGVNAALAFDGNEGTQIEWAPETGAEHYVTVTLEKEYQIQAVQLVWEGASAKEYTVTLTPAAAAGAMQKAAAEPKVFTVTDGIGGAGMTPRKNLYNEDFSTIPAQTVKLETKTAATGWGIKLKEMKVMGSEKNDGPTGVEAIEVTPDTIVDVYNLQGVRVLRDAKVTDIINLPAGIYVAGGRKYIVR
jgi:F5/8 type C domain